VARTFGTVACEERPGRRPSWYIDCRIGGRRYRLRGMQTKAGRWVRFADETQAQEALEEIRSDLRRGVAELLAVADFLPSGAPETWFERHWRRFVQAKVRQGKEDGRRQLSHGRLEELRGYEGRGHLGPLLQVPLPALSYGVLEDWRDALFAKGLAPKTVHHLIADVGTCLRWLHKRGELAVVPPLPEVMVPEYAPKIPTPAAQDALLDAIPLQKRGAFLARGYMGLRPSEAARANVEDYDFERDVLTVHGKGWRVRYLPAAEEVAAWVREVHGEARLRVAGRPLFPNPDAHGDEKRWTKAAARRVMLEAMKVTGMKFKPNEALRHGFATHAAARGVELERVSAYLGHTDARTTRRYAKLASSDLAGVPRRGPRVVAGGRKDPTER